MPKSGYRTHFKYGKMFSNVHGKIWIDEQDFVWMKADANVVAPFLNGFVLGESAAGDAHPIRTTRIAEGTWLPKRIEIKAEAKIIFLQNYQMQEVITYSEYHPR
jgi:hypothetical protein